MIRECHFVWFFGSRRRSDSIWGRNTRRNCFLHPIPLKTMGLSVLLISCRFANIIFLCLDGSLDSRATSLTTFLSFQWILLARAQCRSAPWLLLCSMPACTTEYTRKFAVFSLFLFCRDGGIRWGMTALVLSVWILLAELNLWSLVVFLVGDGEIAPGLSQYILGERVLPIVHRRNSTWG